MSYIDWILLSALESESTYSADNKPFAQTASLQFTLDLKEETRRPTSQRAAFGLLGQSRPGWSTPQSAVNFSFFCHKNARAAFRAVNPMNLGTR